MSDAACPCGLGHPYRACCGRLHRGEVEATTAEQVMRARFAAFAVGDEAYLIRSWAGETRPARLGPLPSHRWTRLEVLAVVDGGMLANDGIVEFRAHHEQHGTPGVLHERSAFTREHGRWVYVGPTG